MEEDEFSYSNRGQLDRVMVSGRYAQGLIAELDAHVAERTANVFQIFDELAALEGSVWTRGTLTKPATAYRGAWLRGLWHKHYSQARFFPRNLVNHWTAARLEKLMEETLVGREYLDDEAIRLLAHGMTIGAYEELAQARKMTGEWIVFARQDEVSYYLTLARHDEEDEAIWHRCAACRPEFPDLLILQEDRA